MHTVQQCQEHPHCCSADLHNFSFRKTKLLYLLNNSPFPPSLSTWQALFYFMSLCTVLLYWFYRPRNPGSESDLLVGDRIWLAHCLAWRWRTCLVHFPCSSSIFFSSTHIANCTEDLATYVENVDLQPWSLILTSSGSDYHSVYLHEMSYHG